MHTQTDIEEMSTRLRAMARDGGSIEAAQVKLIGLDEIRDAAGPRWPRMRERVRSGSMSILSQHTGPDDVIVPAGDGFLIMLAAGPPGDTQRRCQQMRDALLAFYLGDDALASLRPDVKNRSLNAAGLTELISSSLRDETRVVARAHDDEIALAPILVTHEHKASALLAAPVVRSASGRRIAYNPDFVLDGRHHGNQDFLELDIALLDAALARAARWEQMNHKAVIGVCVHTSTMQMRRSREAYLKWLASVDPSLRRNMFVTVAEVERGTPLISITDWCVALRASVPRVCLDFHFSDLAIGSVGSVGAWAAGFGLPSFAGAQEEARSHRLRAQIEFWSKSLHSQGMRLFIHGFQNAAFLEQAHSLGVDLLTSDAHWPFDSATEGACDLELAH